MALYGIGQGGAAVCVRHEVYPTASYSVWPERRIGRGIRVYPEERSEDVYPAERSEDVYPDERSEDVYPAKRSEDVYPDERSEDVYPAERSEDAVGGGAARDDLKSECPAGMAPNKKTRPPAKTAEAPGLLFYKNGGEGESLYNSTTST
jgi:hypothetical protein